MKVTIVTTCPICHCDNFIEVEENDYLDWCAGALAQDAFPYLSADEREMLISHICPSCWDHMFGEQGEDDDDTLGEQDEEWDEPIDIDNDCGFDPYLGCFTDDC